MPHWMHDFQVCVKLITILSNSDQLELFVLSAGGASFAAFAASSGDFAFSNSLPSMWFCWRSLKSIWWWCKASWNIPEVHWLRKLLSHSSLTCTHFWYILNKGLHAESSVDPFKNFSLNHWLKQLSYLVFSSLQSSPIEFILQANLCFTSLYENF